MALRVIVVEDDPPTLAVLAELLRSWDLEVVLCPTFEAGRAALAPTAPHPADVLLVDIRLGMYNGLQLIHMANQLSPGLPAIAMSGFDDPVLRNEARKAGALLMVKPIEPARLLQQLSALAAAKTL